MTDDLKQQIMDYMDRCSICTIATAAADGQPGAATVYFKRSGLEIYFNAGKESQKVKNILANAKVAVSMQEDAPVPQADWDITGIQLSGTAKVLTEANSTGVPKAVMTRHNAFNRSRPGTSVIVRISPSRIHLIEYSQGLRHRDSLNLK
jgi:general stress protein 26